MTCGRIVNVTQGTPEWHDARRGLVTASRVGDLTARTKTGWGASRANYMAELVIERLTNTTAEGYVSKAMAEGTEKEPVARQLYALDIGVAIEEVGFVYHPYIVESGCSPDGLVGAEGMVEFKCPQPATHLGYLLHGVTDGRYIKQMQWQLACTGRRWCDFCSYCPGFPPAMEMMTARIARDDDAIKEMEDQVGDFLAELRAQVRTLEQAYGVMQKWSPPQPQS